MGKAIAFQLSVLYFGFILPDTLNFQFSHLKTMQKLSVVALRVWQRH